MPNAWFRMLRLHHLPALHRLVGHQDVDYLLHARNSASFH